MGPSWKELIESGEVQRVLDRGEAHQMGVDEAIELAMEAHAGATDKAGRPYIEHPIRVMDEMSTDVERMIAILHDVVEDTTVTVDELLERGCPVDVVEAVEVLTKRSVEEYEAFIERIRNSGNEHAVRVKLADISDNANEKRLALLGPVEAERLRLKYSMARRLLLTTGDTKGPLRS
jgi:(p)ppGpp synthase/HD superfamily hydrolase